MLSKTAGQDDEKSSIAIALETEVHVFGPLLRNQFKVTGFVPDSDVKRELKTAVSWSGLLMSCLSL